MDEGEEAELSHYVGRKSDARSSRGCLRRPRIINSTAVIAVLAINSLLDGSYYSTLSTLLKAFGAATFNVVGVNYFVSYILPFAAFQLLYPLAGWVADACWGRHRTIQVSLWVVMAGQSVVFVTFLILPAFQGTTTDVAQVSVYVKVLVALVYACVSIGFAGLQTNVIPFCMDQMADASGDQLSALIHWYYWTSYVRSILIVIFDCLFAQASFQFYTMQFGVTAALMGLALLLWHTWNAKFSVEPRGKNPVGTVCGVLAFASRHRYPLFQSALTSERPSRVELSKSRYGGPFTSEEVEDVKSFFRVSAVLLSLGAFVVVDYGVIDYGTHLSDRYLIGGTKCSLNSLLDNVWDTAPIILGIPLYEFIVYPLLHCINPTTLQSMGLGMLMAIASMVSFMSIDLYGHYQMENNATCFLGTNVSLGSLQSVSSYSLAAPYLLGTLADIFTYIAVYQFICAQAPYNMRGMLFGVFYCITGLFALLSGSIDLLIVYQYKYLVPSCDTVYFATMAFIGVVGFVTFILVANKYRMRKRLDHAGHDPETTELSLN